LILDLIALDNSSKVWIYQADREFSYDELDVAREHIQNFLSTWTSHNAELHTYGNIFHRRFLAIFVDESQSTGASGCSIDKSVHFVQTLGQELGIDFFNRRLYSFFKNEEDIETLSEEDFSLAYANGKVLNSTLVFDNLVKDKEGFIKNWIRPLDQTWIKRLV